jgi:hypothetical protein
MEKPIINNHFHSKINSPKAPINSDQFVKIEPEHKRRAGIIPALSLLQSIF